MALVPAGNSTPSSVLYTNWLSLGAMAEKGKLIIGFDTNCVPDLNALLDDGTNQTQNTAV